MAKQYKVKAEITPKDKGFYVKTFQGGVIEVPVGKKTTGEFLESIANAVKTQTGSTVIIKEKVEWDEDKENDKRPSSSGSTQPKKYFKMADAGFVPPVVGGSMNLIFDTNIDVSELSATYSAEGQIEIDFSAKTLKRNMNSENSNFPITIKLLHNGIEMGSFGLWLSAGNVKKSQINYTAE